jgi:hypothetical protein
MLSLGVPRARYVIAQGGAEMPNLEHFSIECATFPGANRGSLAEDINQEVVLQRPPPLERRSATFRFPQFSTAAWPSGCASAACIPITVLDAAPSSSQSKAPCREF